MEVFKQSLSIPPHSTTSNDDIKLLLKQYNAQLASIDSVTDSYSSQTRSFTSLSSELEASGAEVRRTVRGLLRTLERSLVTCKQDYHQWKVEMESILRSSEAAEKQIKVC